MSDWFEEWLGEGNEIAGSGYFDEKLCADLSEISAQTAKHPQRTKRRSLNHYIINRRHKQKRLSRFRARKRHYGWSIYYIPYGAPVYLRVSRKYHPTVERRYAWGYKLDDMLDTYGRILPKYVYVKKETSFFISVSPGAKRYTKRSCNHHIRIYRGDISSGGYVFKLTSGIYSDILF